MDKKLENSVKKATIAQHGLMNTTEQAVETTADVTENELKKAED